jgi:hypothetical protein
VVVAEAVLRGRGFGAADPLRAKAPHLETDVLSRGLGRIDRRWGVT